MTRDFTAALRAVVNGFTTDPGTTDLDDDQPIQVSIKLGDYRRIRHYLNEDLQREIAREQIERMKRDGYLGAGWK